jgi:hypothetical protein
VRHRTRLTGSPATFFWGNCSPEACNSGKSIEPGIKAQYFFDSVLPHDGKMQRISRGHFSMSHDNLLRAPCRDSIDGQHLARFREGSCRSHTD